MRRLALLPALVLAVSGLALLTSPAHAASPLWKVLSLDSIDCTGATLTYQTTDIPGTGYIAHTRAYVDGLLYMNEDAGDMENETSEWGIYESDSYAPGGNTGTWPMPAGKVVTIILELEKPKGTVVSSWKLNVDSCATGKVVYNGLTAGDPDDDLVVGAADKCPAVSAGDRANGCPLLERTVTLKYRAGQQKFVGKIKCPAFEFRQKKNVIVYKKLPGKDQKVGSGKTGLTSHFSIRATAGPGKYYAIVKKGLRPDVGEVRKTKSKVLTIG